MKMQIDVYECEKKKPLKKKSVRRWRGLFSARSDEQQQKAIVGMCRWLNSVSFLPRFASHFFETNKKLFHRRLCLSALRNRLGEACCATFKCQNARDSMTETKRDELENTLQSVRKKTHWKPITLPDNYSAVGHESLFFDFFLWAVVKFKMFTQSRSYFSLYYGIKGY